MPPKDLKPVAIYVRVSTAAQKFASQEDPLNAFCKVRKWARSEVEIFREKASGVAKSRPVLELIMAGCRVGKIKTVVVYKLDRLGRSLTHLSYVVNEFKRMGIALISVTEGIDTSAANPLAGLQINLLGSFGELEREMIRERAKSGYDAARRRGVKVGRPRTLDAKAAQAVALKKKGIKLTDIAKELKISLTSVHRFTKDCGAPRNVRGPDKAPRRRKKKFPKSSPPTLPLFPGQE